MKFYLSFLLMLFLLACSTEKNRVVNRTYHGLTAHYNGYFNANELIDQSITTYRNTLKEDYYKLLPLKPVPNEEEVSALYPALDTAIAKCTKVIAKHSMPTASVPSKKKSEHNPWIDENWLTIGIANYYRRDYDGAVKNFKYVKKFFENDPSTYLAGIWIARSYIQTKKISEAAIQIKELDKHIAELEELKKNKKGFFGKLFSKEKKKKKRKKRRGKKKKDEEEEKAKFTRKSRYLLELTRCELQLAQKDDEKAIEALEKALEFCKKSKEKARIHFILGQLNARNNNSEKAVYHYGKVLRYSAPFEMSFNARINRALMGGGEKLKKELEKMLRDNKNTEFKDQIYYALANIAFKEGDEVKGKELLTRSILVSLSNRRQKAMAYEKLGDLSFRDRAYIPAQKYYDSCAAVLPDDYPNGEIIQNKALKLKDLVAAVETAAYEDSVQRIAKMSASERESYVKKVLEKIKREEAERKAREEARLKDLQARQAALAEQKSSTKFFWNNAKVKGEGLETFRKQWGQRENEDDWRRSDKVVLAKFEEQEGDSLSVENKTEDTPEIDSLTPESLLSKLPISDSAYQASRERMLNALFDAGVIYKDLLKEDQLAVQRFEKVVAKDPNGNYGLMSLYQLYLLYNSKDPTKSYPYKEKILKQFPDSDYAKYLTDPEFFVKQKELEKLNQDDYQKLLERYNRGLYSFVATSCETVINEDLQNHFRAKYMLLHAMCLGKMNEDKKLMLPGLERLVKDYPKSDEAKRAQELIALINKGVSKYEDGSRVKKGIYEYEGDAAHWVIIFLEPRENPVLAKSKIADFNRAYFSRDDLTVSSKVFGKDQSIILIDPFDADKAVEYIKVLKRTKQYVSSLHENKMYGITRKNLKKLFETSNLEEYDLFYLDNY
ncbi:MAG: hypothetical protein EP338_02690 [Bacteroidetes bacterium]|nr:MAG: hypothetical protein EP338_02690 [Bacteroidota bacterium]